MMTWWKHFFLSLFFEGRIGCFSPVTYLERKDITLLRPLIYLEEKEIRQFAREAELPVVENVCPASGNTKRQYVKETVDRLEREHRGLKQRVFTAVKSAGLEGWGTDGADSRREQP